MKFHLATSAARDRVVLPSIDALPPYGVRHIDMPATPEKVWAAIRAGSAKRAAE